MSQKHYIIAIADRVFMTNSAVTPVFGTIISAHQDASVAIKAARAINLKNRVGSTKAVVGVLTTDKKLKTNEVHPELATQWLKDKYDRDAVSAMKYMLDPNWTGKPVSDETIGWMVVELNISEEELRERYEEIARQELEENQRKLLSHAEGRARAKAVGDRLATDRALFVYSFPAVAGKQADKVFYVAQIPYAALVRLFTFDPGEAMSPEHRAQRVLSEPRARGVAKYILDNPVDYVLPALTASVSAAMTFEPMAVAGAAGSLGILRIPMDATLLINDGQHRRHGIEQALAARPDLARETIAVTIYFDEGLRRSQQMFADINGKAVKPSTALSMLYDHRNPHNDWVQTVLKTNTTIAARVDFENGTVAAKSHKLWSLIAFKKFLTLLTGVTEHTITSIEPSELAKINTFITDFFAACSTHIPQWRAMMSNQIPAFEVREYYVIGHAVFLEALAVFARFAMFYGHLMDHGSPWLGVIRPDIAIWPVLDKLSLIDPMKNSPMWQNRCVVLGKMQKTTDGINATAARLLTLADIRMHDWPDVLRKTEARITPVLPA